MDTEIQFYLGKINGHLSGQISAHVTKHTMSLTFAKHRKTRRNYLYVFEELFSAFRAIYFPVCVFNLTMLSSLNIAGHLFLKKCKECTYAVELSTFTIFYRARIFIRKKPFFSQNLTQIKSLYSLYICLLLKCSKKLTDISFLQTYARGQKPSDNFVRKSSEYIIILLVQMVNFHR